MNDSEPRAPMWDPIPRRLSADLACVQWTKTMPAPEAVAYLWCWRQIRDGALPGIRELARYAARGKTWATRVRSQVKADFESWRNGGTLVFEGAAIPNGTPAGQSGTLPGHPTQTDTASQTSDGTARDSAGHPRDSSRARAPLDRTETETLLPEPAGSSPTDEPKPTKRDQTRATARRIYAHWHQHHPQAAEKPATAALTKIESRLREPGITEEDCIAVIDWLHKAPDASHWQGDNDRGRKFLGISTAFKADKWGDRLEAARKWSKPAHDNGEKRPPAGSTANLHFGKDKIPTADLGMLWAEQRWDEMVDVYSALLDKHGELTARTEFWSWTARQVDFPQHVVYPFYEELERRAS